MTSKLLDQLEDDQVLLVADWSTPAKDRSAVKLVDLDLPQHWMTLRRSLREVRKPGLRFEAGATPRRWFYRGLGIWQ